MKAYFLWLAKLITILVVLFLIVPAFFAAIAIVAKGVDPATGLVPGKNQVAVVELSETILDSKEIVKQLHKQVSNKSVQGIVLRVNSPGGAVAPSQDIYHAIQELKVKKPIVASFGSVAASGGLYSALSASKIYAQTGTQTGSIGVIIQIPNIQKIAEKYNFSMLTIKSGELKDVGNPFREMTKEDKEFLQSTVDTINEDFIQAVADGRKIPVEKVKTFADGRMILGSEALELGLVDEIGGLHEAARAVYEILGKPLPKGEYPSLVYTKDHFKEVRKLLKSLIDIPVKILNPSFAGYEIKYLMY